MNEREFSLIKAISEEFSANIAELKIELKKEIDERFIDLEGKVEFLKQSLPIQNLNIDDVSSLIDKGFSSILKQTIANLPIPKDGKSVTAEELRPMIEEEIAKYLPEPIDTNVLVDEVLKQIPKPEKAKDGRDALNLEISPLIDEKKSYPRGTYAIHNGGLWRSHEQTHGMRGWECVVDGVATIEMEQQNKRCFSISIKKSSGFEELKSFEIPVMIYRDIFKSGNEYQPGDTVTWGGSLWHCNQKTMDKPGEPNSIGWTLAVKKGRDLRGKP